MSKERRSISNRISYDTDHIEIICKDKTIYLQEGMLPNIEYININFNFQKSQGKKKLTLEFTEYESHTVNNILLNEFMNNDVIYIKYHWVLVDNFYMEYSLSHFMNYLNYSRLLLNYYFNNYNNSKNSQCMSIFSAMINGIYIYYPDDGDKRVFYYVYSSPENMEQYKKVENENKGLDDMDTSFILEKKSYKNLFNSISNIYDDLSEEYFTHLKDEVKKLTTFCEKYGFTEDRNSLPMQHLLLYEKICGYDSYKIIIDKQIALTTDKFKKLKK